MSKDSRNILVAVLIAFLVVFIQGIVAHRDLVEEIRVGDGHVSSAVHQYNSGELDH